MQAETSFVHKGAERFLSPPGLELSESAEDMRTVALENIDHILSQLGDHANHQAATKAIREEIINKIDARVASVADELWTRARQMMNRIQQKHKETTNKLLEEVARCRERQHALEAENAKLKQGIQSLAARCSFLGRALSGKDMDLAGSPSPSILADVSSASVSLPALAADASDFFAPAAFMPPGSGKGMAAVADCLWGAAKLPDVPQFPFPAQPMSPGTPLSLAEALGTETPAPTHSPLSLANSLAPALGVGTHMGSEFGFMLQKGNHAQDQTLSIEAWNHWSGCAPAGIVAITDDKRNNSMSIPYEQQTAVEECKDSVVARTDGLVPDTPAGKFTILRAEASVFVPMSVDSSSQNNQEEIVSEWTRHKPGEEVSNGAQQL